MQLYNSLTQTIDEFKPFNDKKVTIYVCGVTPYDTTHLGHASTYMFFDVLIRYLRYLGYEVNYTQNVTDIDDDVLKKAKETNRHWVELGEYWTKRFLNDLKALNVEAPTNYVKATESISSMVRIIELLIKKGIAYERHGNVYYNVAKFPRYGELSHFNKHQMLHIAKERGADLRDQNKINPLDFILWQKSKENEPNWESPWSAGRPGWHIECSAMVKDYLGEQIDIHGGGRDLVYPHHESEIAQTEAYTGKTPYVKYWLHTAMVMYQGEKMSKSLGNLVMVSDLLKKYTPNAIRWFLLSHKYRIPWEFYYEELDQAQDIVNNIENTIAQDDPVEFEETVLVREIEKALDEDMDTARALKILVENTSNLQKEKDIEKALDFKNRILFAYRLLGFIV